LENPIKVTVANASSFKTATHRVKSVMTTDAGISTTYFVGTHYEVTNEVVTKYYFAGTQRIAMRKNGVLTICSATILEAPA
jgi:hypothetical protein